MYKFDVTHEWYRITRHAGRPLNTVSYTDLFWMGSAVKWSEAFAMLTADEQQKINEPSLTTRLWYPFVHK